MKLSIIMPVYNEEKTVIQILDKVVKSKLSIGKEMVIVDDGSRDNSKKLIEGYIKKKKQNKNLSFKFISKTNGGKGSAVKAGIRISTGDIVIIQDADLEYNPEEYQKLINPILSKQQKVVYGSRMLNKAERRYSGLLFYIGGVFVTFVTNLLYGSKLTDEPTCYKVFEGNLIRTMRIDSNGFEWEPEITAKILKKGIAIHELPISYNPRNKKQGKKIKAKDGIKAIWTLLKYKFREET